MKELIFAWKEYVSACNNLRNYLGTSNFVGELAEKLVSSFYKGKQLGASTKSYDIILSDGKKIQVKARQLESTPTTQLGIIRSWEFDSLVVVLFNRNGSIYKAIEIDSNTAKKFAKENSYQHGFVITTTNEFLNNDKVKDITDELNSILGYSKIEYSLQENTNKINSIIDNNINSEDLIDDTISWNGITIYTKRASNCKFQHFVRETLYFFLKNNLISKEELDKLHTKEYSKKVFNIEFPLLISNSKEIYDSSNHARYWVNEFPGGYYVCKKWWKKKLTIYEPLFAKWIVSIIKKSAHKNFEG